MNYKQEKMMDFKKCKFKTKNAADLTNCLSSVMPEEKRKPIYSAEIQVYAKHPSFIMKYFVQICTADVFPHTHRHTKVILQVSKVSLLQIQQSDQLP